MTNNVDLALMTVPFDELDDYTKPFPTIATVREIDARIVDNEISFFFSKGNYVVDVVSYPGGLDGLLADVRDDNLPMPDTKGLKPKPPIPPLSLKNIDTCYVVYRLAPLKNWQFASNHSPFTIGQVAHAKASHFHARRFDAQGNHDKIKDGKPNKDDCVVAYFISDGRTASGFTGQYIHALNIHVELLFGTTDKGRIPLIIDPDVRFPGGSGA